MTTVNGFAAHNFFKLKLMSRSVKLQCQGTGVTPQCEVDGSEIKLATGKEEISCPQGQ